MSYTLMDSLFSTNSIGNKVKPLTQYWAKMLNVYCSDLKKNSITIEEWRNLISQLYQQIELKELLQFIEFDKFVTHKCTSFGMEANKYYGDGVVTGIAEINGQKVALYSQDFTCWGGALGAAHAKSAQ